MAARVGDRGRDANGVAYVFDGRQWKRVDGGSSPGSPYFRQGGVTPDSGSTSNTGVSRTNPVNPQPFGPENPLAVNNTSVNSQGVAVPPANSPLPSVVGNGAPAAAPQNLAPAAPTAPVAVRPTGPQPQPTTLASPGRVSAAPAAAPASAPASAPATPPAARSQPVAQQPAPAPAAPAPPPRDPWMNPQEGDVLQSGGYSFTVVGFRGDGRAILHGSDGLVYIHDPETGNLYETPESAAANPNPRLPQPEPQREAPKGIDPTAGSHPGEPIAGNRSTLDPGSSTGGSAATLPQATARWNPEAQQWENDATGQSGPTVGSTQPGSAPTQTAGTSQTATAPAAPAAQGTTIDPRTIPGTPEWVRSVGLGKAWEDYAVRDPEGSRRFHGGNAAIQPGVTVPDVGGNLPSLGSTAATAAPTTETEEQKRKREEEERRRAIAGDSSLFTTSSAAGLPRFAGGGSMPRVGTRGHDANGVLYVFDGRQWRRVDNRTSPGSPLYRADGVSTRNSEVLEGGMPPGGAEVLSGGVPTRPFPGDMSEEDSEVLPGGVPRPHWPETDDTGAMPGYAAGGRLPRMMNGGMMPRYAAGGMPQTMTASSSSLPSMAMEPNAVVGEGEMAPGDHRVELVLLPTAKPGEYIARYAEGPQAAALPEGAIVLPQADHTQELVRSSLLPISAFPLKTKGGTPAADSSVPGDPAAAGDLPEYAAGGRTPAAGVLPQLGGVYPGTNMPTIPQGGPWAGITPQPYAGNLNQIAGMTPMGQTRLDQQYKSQGYLGGLEDQIALFRKSAPGTGSFSTRG